MSQDKDKNSLEKQHWYHGFRSRKDVAVLLLTPGDFLVRATDTNGCTEIVISVKDDKGDIKHLTLKNNDNVWHLGVLRKINNTNKFKTIVELIDYYKVKSLPGKIHLKRAIPRPMWLLKHEQVVFSKEKDLLGSGNFCHVYKGVYYRTPDISMTVAVKLCHEGHASDRNWEEGKEARNAMLGEAEIMNYYTHQNVIQLHGVACDHPPVLIVMEYCPGGNLEHHLKKNGDTISSGERSLYALEAARGMQYLHSKNCIHRDLAARNCLISTEGRIKIADFGLSKIVKEDTNNKTLEISSTESVGSGLPCRWMSPESLAKKMTFSAKTDVWSFAVLVYEIFNNGIKPWPDDNEWPAKRIATHIRKCQMPDPPSKTPSRICDLLKSIWVLDADKRPTMKMIVVELSDIVKKAEMPPPNKMVISSVVGVSRKSQDESIDFDDDGNKCSIDDKVTTDTEVTRMNEPKSPAGDLHSADGGTTEQSYDLPSKEKGIDERRSEKRQQSFRKPNSLRRKSRKDKDEISSVAVKKVSKILRKKPVQNSKI